MHPATQAAFLNELEKIGKIKSNDRMPPRTKAHVSALMEQVGELEGKHRKPALSFAEKVTPVGFFELLHSIRRWYTGQTMTGKLHEYNDSLKQVMKLEPEDAVGSFRGFKVPKDSELAKLQVGDTTTLPVTRNHGISSWSTTEAPTNRFSGGGKGKVGLIVKLVDSEGIKPLLAPPSHTKPWFNELYTKTIGKSFRPIEQEYVVAAPQVKVEVVRVKK